MSRDLRGARYISLVTFRRSGAEVATPVWVTHLEGRLYIIATYDSGKAKRLRNNPRVRLAACNMSGSRILGPWHEGTARQVDDPALVRRAMASLWRKYNWQLFVAMLLFRLKGMYPKRRVLEIALEPAQAA